MRDFVLTLGILLVFLVPANAQTFGDCNDGPADFQWTIDGCCVTFLACNSAGLGTWNFGDGTGTTGQGAYHCYSSPGTYFVSKNFMGQTITNTVVVSSCEVECDLEAKYCPDGQTCYTDYVPGSYYHYYCNRHYDVTTSGGTPPFTYSWEVCYYTNFGTLCNTFTGASIDPIGYQVYYIWNGGWQLFYQRYIRTVCVTVTDANGCEFEDCSGCILTRPGDLADVPTAEIHDLELPTRLPNTMETTETEPMVFPNITQAGQEITVVLPYFHLGDRQLPARLMNLSGQLVQQYNLEMGRDQLHLPSDLSDGVYVLQVADGQGGMTTHKIVVR